MKTISLKRIVFILLLYALLCGAAHAAQMGIVAETHVTSGAVAPACPAGCDCMSETAAIAKWGTTGYESCSKTICGQSADAMVQYYCFHAIAGPAPQSTLAPAAPVQPAVPSAAGPAAPAPIATKSPVGTAPIIAAISAALLAAAGRKRR